MVLAGKYTSTGGTRMYNIREMSADQVKRKLPPIFNEVMRVSDDIAHIEEMEAQNCYIEWARPDRPNIRFAANQLARSSYVRDFETSAEYKNTKEVLAQVRGMIDRSEGADFVILVGRKSGNGLDT
jgi:hypothetical protein